LDSFLRSKTVLEIIKADFRANAAQTLNNAGESALRDAIKGVRERKTKKSASQPDAPMLPTKEP
jgi:hypothetical protein